MKFLIKNFQIKNNLTKKLCAQISSFCRLRKKRNQTWFVNFEKFVEYNERLYVFDNKFVREKIVNKNYNNLLIEHFDVEKILKLIQFFFNSITLNKRVRMFKLVIFVNVLKYRNINYIMNWYFCLFLKSHEKKYKFRYWFVV